jgi:hypothetical protein
MYRLGGDIPVALHFRGWPSGRPGWGTASITPAIAGMTLWEGLQARQAYRFSWSWLTGGCGTHPGALGLAGDRPQFVDIDNLDLLAVDLDHAGFLETGQHAADRFGGQAQVAGDVAS